MDFVKHPPFGLRSLKDARVTADHILRLVARHARKRLIDEDDSRPWRVDRLRLGDQDRVVRVQHGGFKQAQTVVDRRINVVGHAADFLFGATVAWPNPNPNVLACQYTSIYFLSFYDTATLRAYTCLAASRRELTIGVMAKRKPTDPEPLAPPKPPNRSGVALFVYVPPELRAAIVALAARTRRTLTTEVVIALENHAKKNGLWPPDAAES